MGFFYSKRLKTAMTSGFGSRGLQFQHWLFKVTGRRVWLSCCFSQSYVQPANIT